MLFSIIYLYGCPYSCVFCTVLFWNRFHLFSDPSDCPFFASRWGSDFLPSNLQPQRLPFFRLPLGFELPPLEPSTPATAPFSPPAGVRASSTRSFNPSDCPFFAFRWGSSFLHSVLQPQRLPFFRLPLGFELPPLGPSTPATALFSPPAGVRASSPRTFNPSDCPFFASRWGSDFLPSVLQPQRLPLFRLSLGFELPPLGPSTPATDPFSPSAGVRASSPRAFNPSDCPFFASRWGSSFLPTDLQPQRLPLFRLPLGLKGAGSSRKYTCCASIPAPAVIWL